MPDDIQARRNEAMDRFLAQEEKPAPKKAAPKPQKPAVPRVAPAQSQRPQVVCQHPPVTKELIARGVLLGWWYIVLVNAAVAIVVGLLFLLGRALG